MPRPLAWILIALFPVALAASLLRRRRIPPAWMLVGAGVLGVLSGAVARREPLGQLTPERLQAARAEWKARGPRSYDLEVVVHADRLEDGDFLVRVREGQPVATTRNGLPTTGVEEGYTVPALFDM